MNIKALLASRRDSIMVPLSRVFLISRDIGVKQEGRAQEKNGSGKQKAQVEVLGEAEFYSVLCKRKELENEKQCILLETLRMVKRNESSKGAL